MALFGIAACARLENKYLPANQGGRGYSEGGAAFAPKPSGQYGAPSGPAAGQFGGSGAGQYNGAAAGQYAGQHGDASGQYNGAGQHGDASGQYNGAGQHGGAAGPHPGAQIPILRYENNNNGDGTYNYLYETGDGINAQEQGTGGVGAEGGFSYTSPEGQLIQITYTADEHGFHPQGDHLPTPPPIPEEILKSIEFNKAEAARGENQEGAYNEAEHGEGTT